MRRFFGLLLAAGLLSAIANAAPGTARIHSSQPGSRLTAPSGAAAATVALDFLRARGLSERSARAVVTRADHRGADGIEHLVLAQEVAGLRVQGAYAKASLDARGRLVHLIDNLAAVPAGGVELARANEADALRAALAGLYPGAAVPAAVDRQGNVTLYAAGGVFRDQPRVERVAIPSGGTLKEGFLVETWAVPGGLHETLVGGDGRVLSVVSRTNTDRYNVFTVSPLVTPQTIVSGPGAGNAQSPVGWLFAASQLSVNIAGNNVHAYLDAQPNDQPDKGGTAVTNGDFLSAAVLTQQPSIEVNRNVAVQNLFYLNNVIHDTLYRFGFTEGAGNFQADNFGKGGAGGDSVNAEAQDGAGVDNANFSTPPDGRSGRMQMFLWSGFGTHEVLVNAPATIAGSYLAQGAAFGSALSTTGVTGDVQLANDGTGTVTDACEPLPPMTGKIALVDRGTCLFVVKVFNAQAAGATGVIVANNVDGRPFTMGASGDPIDNRVRIPAVMISRGDGATIKSGFAAGVVNATERLRNPPPLMFDGDVDSDIVWHEYGHGLTWRMIGDMDGPLAGAIGEGMSDVLAILMNNDDVVGEYAADTPLGIRRAPYADYPLTYGAMNSGEVHNDGEAYAAIGWRMGENFAKKKLSRDLLLTYIVDGMNYTPSRPAYEDMRDGILQSVANAGQGHECLVWEAFAHYGVGVGASGVETANGVVITESFELPKGCH